MHSKNIRAFNKGRILSKTSIKRDLKVRIERNDTSRTPILIMGVCSRGPYHYAKNILNNPDVEWISWGYFVNYIHPHVIKHIKSGKIKSGTEVIFATWDIGIEKRAILLRKGVIDYTVFKKEYANFTIFLKEMISGFIKFSEKDHFLCRYHNIKEVKGNNG